jgi:AcrR family transcriptional regulator
VLREDGSGQNLREYLIATAARLIDQRGSAGIAVRDIAREAQVADGVLYNYFEDKEDLLAHALLAHVGTVMAGGPPLLLPPGEGTVAENLRMFIDGGMARLVRVTPAFAGLLSQPKVLIRFHAMVGGDSAFGVATEGTPGRSGGPAGAADPTDGPVGGADGSPGGAGGRGLGEILTSYLRAEQRLGRIDAAADVDAAVSLIVGAIHGQILPRVLFSPPGRPVVPPSGLAARLAETVLSGIAPKPPRP